MDLGGGLMAAAFFLSSPFFAGGRLAGSLEKGGFITRGIKYLIR